MSNLNLTKFGLVVSLLRLEHARPEQAEIPFPLEVYPSVSQFISQATRSGLLRGCL